MSNQTLVFETSEKLDTNFVVPGISENKYYQITTEDVWGYQLTSDIEVLHIQVELWGEYYSIENTTSLDFSYWGIIDFIPPEIGNLTNLEGLMLYNNQLTGEIPESICDTDIHWNYIDYFNITNNQLCPPYQSCIEDYVGEQDTTNCD